MKKTARAAALAGWGPLLQGCSSTKQFDLVVKDGLLYDGLGGEPFVADIGIAGESIEFIGKIKNGRGAILVEAKNLAVSPGFIDVHDHSDVGLIVNPAAESHIHQGITTLVSGNCGETPFPIPEATLEETRQNLRKIYDLELNWRDMVGFFSRLEEKGIALNYATLAGHGSIRAAAMGFLNRPPTGEELGRMKGLVEEHIRNGAFGLSTGLEYTPGGFAQPDEVAELCRVTARLNGIYATHMRDEGNSLLESLDECITAARQTGVRLQISHFKVAYPRNWPKLEDAIAKVEQARRSGVAVFCDRYPYIAGSTGLSIYFPMWAKEGTTEDFINRLKDPTLDARLRAELAVREKNLGSWDRVLLSSVASEKNRHLQGKNILEASKEAQKEPYAFMRDLLIEERGMVGMISFSMSEENLRRILAHPLVGVGCDGWAVAPYGILSREKPHPRNYGTFPRILGRYVREERIAPDAEMIRKMTSIPAARFGFEKRGILKPGNYADIVVFNPETVADLATWTDPHRYPVGIEYVIVNGRMVIAHGEHTGRLPGKVLRKSA